MCTVCLPAFSQTMATSDITTPLRTQLCIQIKGIWATAVQPLCHLWNWSVNINSHHAHHNLQQLVQNPVSNQSPTRISEIDPHFRNQNLYLMVKTLVRTYLQNIGSMLMKINHMRPWYIPSSPETIQIYLSIYLTIYLSICPTNQLTN